MGQRFRLSIKLFRYGDPPHRKLVEGQDAEKVLEEGFDYLKTIKEKYK